MPAPSTRSGPVPLPPSTSTRYVDYPYQPTLRATWREAQADESEVEVPEVPADVRGRLDAIWVDAYRAAVATIAPERDRLAVEVEELRGEVDALTATVEDVETERDEHAARLEAGQKEYAVAVSERDDAAARAERAEERAATVEAERDRLAEQVRVLIERIPAPEA